MELLDQRCLTGCGSQLEDLPTPHLVDREVPAEWPLLHYTEPGIQPNISFQPNAKTSRERTCLEPIALASLLEVGLKSLLHLLLVLRCFARAREEDNQAG